METTALTWLAPILDATYDMTDENRERLIQLDFALDDIESGEDMLTVRRSLARRLRHLDQPAGPASTRAVLDALSGFVCGFRDPDLQDVIGPGHGRLILDNGTDLTRHRWASRLADGDLVGVAATEAHGGTQFQEIATHAVPDADGWVLTGEKCWISGLYEASAFVVFFKDTEGRIAAAVVEADAPGLERHPSVPMKLGNRSWGKLIFDSVRIRPADLLNGPGGAMFRRHFAAARPVIAATALGTAAGVHARVSEALRDRMESGSLGQLRDGDLIALGRSHAEINAALLAAVSTARLTASNHPSADLWSRGGKAMAVETANRSVADLVTLVSASGFQASPTYRKVRRDLTAMSHADGLHRELLRSAGETLMNGSAGATWHPSQRMPGALV